MSFIGSSKKAKYILINLDYFSKIPKNENIAIFFGVTASIFEALETGTNVIHICSDPVFDSHSDKICPNLKV